jgi:hypothetical protein
MEWGRVQITPEMEDEQEGKAAVLWILVIWAKNLAGGLAREKELIGDRGVER